MEKKELIKYWIESSEIDYLAMENLFRSKDYVWSLFLGHLVVEKLLKALSVYNTRYPDYKQEFYKKCNPGFTSDYIARIKGIRLWLLEQLKK